MDVDGNCGNQISGKIAEIFATAFLRLSRGSLKKAESISRESALDRLELQSDPVLSVSTRVNPPESSPTNGEAHEH